jgi:xanthine dehydrogenase YagS FAD-binding subunit
VRPVEYVRATTAEEAVRVLAQRPGAKVLAGGTNLVDLMKLDVERPPVVVDVTRAGLDLIEETAGGGLRIGAGVRNSDVAVHPAITGRYPVLAEALLAGASPQLRNMATVGGNLLQRTRCWYFMDTGSACNKRQPGAGCSAYAGNQRQHAVLGVSEHCIAAHPSDMCVALAALGAVVVTAGPHGQRRIPFGDFYLLPDDTPQRETTLGADEVILAVDLPAPADLRWHYAKARDRQSYAFALASVAAGLAVDGGRVTSARVALGGVGAVPWRSPEAEQMLVGRPVDAAVFEEAAEAALAGANTRPGNAFKVVLTRRLLVATLTRLAAA